MLKMKRALKKLSDTPNSIKGWAKVGIPLAFLFSLLPVGIFYLVGLKNPLWYMLTYAVSVFASYLVSLRFDRNLTGEIRVSDLRGYASFGVITISGMGALVGCFPETTSYGAWGLTIALLANFWTSLKKMLLILI